MHPALADKIVEQVRKRVNEGDCPTTEAFGVETLEEAVLELADRPAKTLRTLAEAMKVFAPDLADQLTKRWADAMKAQDERLEAFLAVLRS
jgi:hypothetical protein